MPLQSLELVLHIVEEVRCSRLTSTYHELTLSNLLIILVLTVIELTLFYGMYVWHRVVVAIPTVTMHFKGAAFDFWQLQMGLLKLHAIVLRAL